MNLPLTFAVLTIFIQHSHTCSRKVSVTDGKTSVDVGREVIVKTGRVTGLTDTATVVNVARYIRSSDGAQPTEVGLLLTLDNKQEVFVAPNENQKPTIQPASAASRWTYVDSQSIPKRNLQVRHFMNSVWEFCNRLQQPLVNCLSR